MLSFAQILLSGLAACTLAAPIAEKRSDYYWCRLRNTALQDMYDYWEISSCDGIKVCVQWSKGDHWLTMDDLAGYDRQNCYRDLSLKETCGEGHTKITDGFWFQKSNACSDLSCEQKSCAFQAFLNKHGGSIQYDSNIDTNVVFQKADDPECYDTYVIFNQ
ncbi:hypothetical protein SJAG_03148 [Schizosaccharomyces japonicus yFS275]|uniref:Uncharacterized protein n=1 Tax=Schizosaccharomyces japonicus (strain yFS275 / FY16936) TaxID=402676 RepID=B6K3G4_SCHJY|nr:hypothetical protein SJAG_03148 [Schizosaccharomyces japonicus yFS275]EEB08021.1 hypothetical protein SJAG_03148 [Schizosaccharomyces japonicus yFS275]